MTRDSREDDWNYRHQLYSCQLPALTLAAAVISTSIPFLSISTHKFDSPYQGNVVQMPVVRQRQERKQIPRAHAQFSEYSSGGVKSSD